MITEPQGMLGYCHVPKVASTTIMTSFAEMNFLEYDAIEKYLKELSLHDHLIEKFSLRFPSDVLKLSDLFNFVFLRHPFDRLASAFHDKIVK